MTRRKRKGTGYRNMGMTSTPILLLFGWTLATAFYGYIFSYALRGGEGNIPCMVLPMVGGLMLENWRTSGDWIGIQVKLLASLFIGLVVFFPGKHGGSFNFDLSIELWPYCFVAAFVFLSIVDDDKLGVVPVGEGFTLLQTIALLYLLVEREWYNSHSSFQTLILLFVCAMAVYVLLHAFTYWKITNTHRLVLSLWSSLIMLVFAGDHLSRVSSFHAPAKGLDTSNFLTALEFFLLGVAAIYIVRNVLMLAIYLPSKQRFYGALHRAEIKATTKLHIERYSKIQLPISDAILVLMSAILLFVLNYSLGFLADHTFIWLVFWIVPFLLWLRYHFLIK